ncbi:hypothetical protein [Cysteiniphilum halobium]|uniref:hypothetical protein n=1 Tax=Cysteiniphilum halobium TaxID=2219059 RepID=UPI000E649DAA|nr:hypothetical protein [Cysteiniphilum halobium]
MSFCYISANTISINVDLSEKKITQTGGIVTSQVTFDRQLIFDVGQLDLNGKINRSLNGYFKYYCGYYFYSYCNSNSKGTVSNKISLSCNNGVELTGTVTSEGDNFYLKSSNVTAYDKSPDYLNIRSYDLYHIKKLHFIFDNIQLADSSGISSCSGKIKINGSFWLDQYQNQHDRNPEGESKKIKVDNQIQMTLNFLPYMKLKASSLYKVKLTENSSSGNYNATVIIPYVTNANNVIVKLKSCDSHQDGCALKNGDGEHIPLKLKINGQELNKTDQDRSIAISQASNELNVDLIAAADAVKKAKPGKYTNKIVFVLTANF